MYKEYDLILYEFTVKHFYYLYFIYNEDLIFCLQD
jgi:hypothetical protein